MGISYSIEDKWVKPTPIIEFKSHQVMQKKKVEIYENELNLILDDGTNYNISFDLHNGGECTVITEKNTWFKNEKVQNLSINQQYSNNNEKKCELNKEEEDGWTII